MMKSIREIPNGLSCRLNQALRRRNFVKTALLASLYGLFWGCAGALTPRRSHKVVVIGAGMSGIAAARELVSRGIDVTVLESRMRLGGRIWSNSDLGVTVDLGATWIEGTSGNPLTKLARQFGIETRTTADAWRVFDFDGREITDKEISRIEREFSALQERAGAIGEESESDISIGAAIRRVLDGEKISPFERRALDWITGALETDTAEDFENVSLWYADADDAFGGDDVIFPKGYVQIVEGLAGDLDVRMNSPVAEVRTNSSGVVVNTQTESFSADAVLVTVPLGILKARRIAFDPPLPSAKRAAIGRLGMGVLNKVVLRYPEVFWDPKSVFYGYMSKTKGEFPEIMNLQPFLDAPIIVGYSGGNYAREWERHSDEIVAGRLASVLATISGTKIPPPESYLVTKWGSDPYSLGSYSHIPAGARPEDYDALAEPAGRVYFAGEATNRRYPGTVHGAFLSGIREAKRIAADF